MTLAESGGDGTLDAPLVFDELFFRRLGLEPGRSGVALHLDVVAAGFRGATREVRLSGDVIHLGTLVLEAGAEVVGRVYGEDGAPVPRAEVRWLEAGAFPSDAALARENGVWSWSDRYQPLASADGAGAFRLEGVPALRGFLAGRGLGTAWGWSEVFDVRAGATLEVDLVLPRAAPEGEIAGVVLDADGRPLASALVRDSAEVEPDSHGERYADEQGRFRFSVKGTAARRVRAQDPEERWYPAEAAGVLPGTLDLVLRLGEPRWLEVAVTDTDGAPLPWSSVRGEVEGVLYGAIPMRQADERGVLRLLRPRQPFRLEAFAPGYRPASFGPFDPAALGARLELALQPGQAVAGRVTHRGRGVPGARLALSLSLRPGTAAAAINATPLDQPFVVLGTTRLDGHDATTDADGAFVTTLHERGWHSLRVVAEGFPPSVFGPFEWEKEEGARGLELELERGGALEGYVLAAPGREAAGRLVAASSGWGFAVSTAADEHGWYRLEGLQPGPWQVRPGVPPLGSEEMLFASWTTRDSSFEALWDCEVRAGETTRFDLDLRDHEAFVLEGELRTAWAVGGWKAELREVDAAAAAGDEGARRAPFPVGSASLDDGGRFRIALSRGGRMHLSLSYGIVELSQELVLERGSNPWHAELSSARLRLSGAPRAAAGAELYGLQYLWEGPGGLQLVRSIFLSDLVGGEPALIDVPAGPGRLVALERVDGPGGVLRLVPRTLREVDLAEGQELLLDLP